MRVRIPRGMVAEAARDIVALGGLAILTWGLWDWNAVVARVVLGIGLVGMAWITTPASKQE